MSAIYVAADVALLFGALAWSDVAGCIAPTFRPPDVGAWPGRGERTRACIDSSREGQAVPERLRKGFQMTDVQGTSHSTAPSVTEQDSVALVDELCLRYRNWGRWGADDQRGTLNFITPEVLT